MSAFVARWPAPEEEEPFRPRWAAASATDGNVSMWAGRPRRSCYVGVWDLRLTLQLSLVRCAGGGIDWLLLGSSPPLRLIILVHGQARSGKTQQYHTKDTAQ